MRNTPILKVLVFLLPVLLAARFAFADIAGDMKRAEELFDAGQYSEAEQTYQAVLQAIDPNKPEDIQTAFAARKKLPLVYLATDRQPQAQTSVRQLLSAHHDHERLPHSVHEIVEQAKKHDRTLQAGQVCQDIITAQPNHPQAIWLKMGVAIANARLGNDQAVDSVLQNIISEDAGDDRSAEALGQTAWAYRKLDKHEEARNVYQYVVDNWPDKDRAIFSQRGIILCSLKLNEPDAADAATQQLLQNFSEDENTAKVLWTVADVYKKKQDWERMRPLCEYILQNHSDDQDAIWAQQALIFDSIQQEDATGVESGIQQLFAKFSSHKAMPAAAYGTARKLNRKNDATAEQLYQYVVDNHPEHDYVPFARVNLGQIKLRRGDDNGAEAAFQKVLADYQDHPRLAEAIHLMAEGYWYAAFKEPRRNRELTERAKGCFQNALAKWERIITQFPEIPFTTPEAHYLAGQCCYRLGQYDRAIQYYQKTADNWPEYQNAWVAQSGIAKVYKSMLRDGVMPPLEAEAAMKAAYEKLVATFPSCPVAGRAREWIVRYSSRTKGGEK